MKIGGWLCVLGSALVLLNLVAVLLWSPEGWRRGSGTGALEPEGSMHADLLLGWFGWWGYAGHLIWVPIALAKGWQAWHKGQRPSLVERSLVLADVCVVVSISLLVRFTWLKYPSFNIPLL